MMAFPKKRKGYKALADQKGRKSHRLSARLKVHHLVSSPQRLRQSDPSRSQLSLLRPTSPFPHRRVRAGLHTKAPPAPDNPAAHRRDTAPPLELAEPPRLNIGSRLNPILHHLTPEEAATAAARCCSRWEDRAHGPPSSRCQRRSSSRPASAPRSPTRSV